MRTARVIDVLVLLLLLQSLSTMEALGQGVGPDRPAELVEIRIRERDRDQLVERLTLTLDQQAVVDHLWHEYSDTIRRLDQSIAEGALKSVGVAASGRTGLEQVRALDPEKQARFIEQLGSLSRSQRVESDRLREQFLDNVRAILDDDQKRVWERAARALRRDILLNAGRDGVGPNSQVNLGIRVDLFQLIESASSPPTEGNAYGPLWLLLGDVPNELLPDNLVEARSEAMLILQAFEIELDDYLRSGAPLAALDDRRALRAASRRGDDDRVLAMHRRIETTGMTRHIWRLNERTADQFAALLRGLDREEEAERWLWIVNIGHFPEIYGSDIVDFMADWMRTKNEQHPEQLSLVNSVYEEYQRRRRQLYAELKAEDVRIRERLTPYVPASAEPGMFERWDALRSEIEEAKLAALEKMKATGSPESKEQFESVVMSNRMRSERRYINTIEAMRHMAESQTGASEGRRLP